MAQCLLCYGLALHQSESPPNSINKSQLNLTYRVLWREELLGLEAFFPSLISHFKVSF